MKRRLLIAMGDVVIETGGYLVHWGMKLTRLGDRISPRGAYLEWSGPLEDAEPMVYVKDGSSE